MEFNFFNFLFLIISFMIISYGNGDQISDLRQEMEKKLNYTVDLLRKDFENKLSNYKQEINDEIKNNKQSTCDSDWVSYSDRKCYKVLNKKGSETEAKANCSQLDKSSTLITIQSKEEQKFVENYLKDFHNISNNVWIGLEYINNIFQWMDGNELKYENWDENAGKDGNNKCVQMSIIGNDLGQWMDDICNKKFLIVCQKKQSSKTILSEEFANITKVIEKQQKQINSLIPLDFLYTQFPYQSTPQQLWPNLKWSEVTQQYSGLFFRAEGSGSETFGQIQQANYSRISNIYTYTINYNGDTTGAFHDISLKEGSVSEDLIPKINTIPYNIKIYTTNGENRPRNTAIKIWKRIE